MAPKDIIIQPWREYDLEWMRLQVRNTFELIFDNTLRTVGLKITTMVAARIYQTSGYDPVEVDPIIFFHFCFWFDWFMNKLEFVI